MKLTSPLGQGLLYGVSIVLMKGISLWMMPLMTSYLTEEQFGQLELITTMAVLGSVVIGFGLEDALYRYAGMANGIERTKVAARIYTMTLMAAVSMLCITHPLVEVVTPYLPAFLSPEHVKLVCYMLAFESAIAIPLGWLRMQNRPIVFFVATTGRAIAQAILVWIALVEDRGVTGILYAGAVTAGVQALLLGWVQYRMSGLGWCANQAKTILKYGLPLVVSGLIAFTLNGADRWLLANHTSLEDVAHYAVATKFALMVVLLLQPFGIWWSPKRFENLDSESGLQKTAQYIVFGITLTFAIALIIAAVVPTVIELLLPPSYEPAAMYAIGLIVAYMFKELTELTNLGCLTGDSTRLQLIINSIAGVLGLLIMQSLTPLFDCWGVILALAIAQGIRVVAFFVFSQRQLPLPYPLLYLVTLFCITALGLSLLIFVDVGLFEPVIAIAFVTLLAGLAFRSNIITWPVLSVSR